MTTATAEAKPIIAFIKYWGKLTETIAVVTRFGTIYKIQNRA
jgi:mevalonate pyrophosphate decarboxylase